MSEHEVTPEDIESAELPLEKDLFMRKMLRELSGTLERVVGLEEASGFVNSVGAIMGQWIDEQYRRNLGVDHLNLQQVAEVCVDLKRRIGGDFYIISVDEDKIVVGNRKCPFGKMAHNRQSLCMMTSNVFGRIAADNLGYARVALDETIAGGSEQCRITIQLRPDPDRSPTEREYYQISQIGSQQDPE